MPALTTFPSLSVSSREAMGKKKSRFGSQSLVWMSRLRSSALAVNVSAVALSPASVAIRAIAFASAHM